MAKKLNRFNTLTQIVYLNAQNCIYGITIIHNFAKKLTQNQSYESQQNPFVPLGDVIFTGSRSPEYDGQGNDH
jgi:hypothetical protein